MNGFRIPAGSRLQVGAPATPLPHQTRDEMAKRLSSVPGVIEAHLPLCQIIPAMRNPALTLVVVLDQSSDKQTSITRILEIVRSLLPADRVLEVWPVGPESSVLRPVRDTNCCLFSVQP